MRKNRWSIPLAAAMLTLSAAGLWRHARAQGDAPPPPPSADQNGGRRFPGFPGGFPGFGGGGGSQLAVAGDNVFILRGGTIYRLDAATLTVKAKADLPTPPPPAGGGGNFRGGGGGPGNAPAQ